MAKKSKRPPARKQQLRRPQTRPAVPQGGVSTAPVSEMPLEDATQDDYAAGALPYTESDGPMPLPPPEVDEDEEESAAPAAAAPAPRPAAPVTATTGTERRRVGRIDPAAAATAQRPGQRVKSGRTTATAAMFEPLPPDDAAIPFDRVPYVPSDLRRVLIIAGPMVVLIVVADIVVNAIVK